MKYATANLAKAAGLVVLGAVVFAGLFILGEWDDAPGASLAGLLLFIGSVVLAVRIARRQA